MSKKTYADTLIDNIVCPTQAREHFDAEAQAGLDMTVREHGVKVPVLLYRRDGKLYLKDGARRIRAAKAAGLKSVPAVIEESDVSDMDALLDQFIVNCQREDLTPPEKAKVIDAAIRNGASAAQVAAKLGVSNATVTRLLAVLALSQPIQDRVASGDIPLSSAYEIARVENPDEQARLADEVAGGLTRDALTGARKASHRTPGKHISPDAPSRVTAKLPGGKSITVAAPQLNLESFIASLEELLGRARQARTKGLALDTFRKVLLDQASTGK